jgi:hypothetical protein
VITTFILWVLSAIGAALFIYSFIDNENRVFGHVFASGIAMVLFFLLGSMVLSGNVGDTEVAEMNRTVVNSTVEYTYTTISIPMDYPAVGWVFIFIGVVALIFTIMVVVEVLRDALSGGFNKQSEEEYG